MPKEPLCPPEFKPRPQTLEEIAEIIHRRAKTRERFDVDLPIELIYFAGSEQDYLKVLGIARSAFGITYPNFQLDFRQEDTTLDRYLRNNSKSFDASPDKTVILSVQHFEAFYERYMGCTFVHFHDQDIRNYGAEGIRKRLPDLSKIVIALIHLGDTKGDSVFNVAWGDIGASQFRSDFVYTKLPFGSAKTP